MSHLMPLANQAQGVSSREIVFEESYGVCAAKGVRVMPDVRYVAIGVIVIGVLALRCTGTLVDIVWIFVYPLIYLVGRSG